MPCRKPLSIRVAEGDAAKVGKRKLAALAAGEPKATTGLPGCPARLKGAARRQWNVLATEIAKMNLDRRPDAAALEGACQAYARALEADAILAVEGLVVAKYRPDENGFMVATDKKPHPAISISRQSWQLYKSFAEQFGLTPVSRTRLATPIDSAKSAMAELQEILHRPRTPRPRPTPQTDQPTEQVTDTDTDTGSETETVQ